MMTAPLDVFGLLPADIFGITVEEARRAFADDCVVREAAGLPIIGGDWHGPEGFVDLMRAIRQTFPNFSFTPDAFFSNGTDALVVTGRIAAELPGGRFDIPLTEFWKFRDGKFYDLLPTWHDTKLVHDLWSASQSAGLSVAF